MKISHTQNEAATACLIKVKIESPDYTSQVEKKLREQRSKLQLPGFRKGMVPLEVARKMYAAAIRMDVVREILGSELYKYMQAQGIKPLGDPIPNEKEEEETNDNEEFNFYLDVALTPALTVTPDKTFTVPYHRKDVNPELLDKQIELLRSLFAPQKKTSAAVEGDPDPVEEKADQLPEEKPLAEMNQDFFNKVFGEGTVSDEEGFRTKVRETLAEMFSMDPDYRFLSDVRRQILDKHGDILLADDVIKRWLVAVKEKTPEAVEKDYPAIREDLIIQIVDSALYNQAALEVKPEDVIRQAEHASRVYFAQTTGCYVPPLFFIQQYTQGVLNHKENIQRITELATEHLLIKWLKEQVTLELRDEPAI
ncbi:MAG: trigger factor family protein [Tannerellaceae bacterium]|jgi:FKBP-type peptidyl-prolyl cis-trans isomerase (trigger factor)|nr:trigger factor family protein [Tannerellaceae bacterium]